MRIPSTVIARALELLHRAQTGLNFSPATALILRRV